MAVTYTIQLTNVEDRVLRGILLDPEEWARSALRNKARKCAIRIIKKYTDKNPKKLSNSQLVTLINSLEFEPRTE